MPEEYESAIKQLLSRLDELTEVRIQMARLEQRYESSEAVLQEVKHAVKGNGKPGIEQRLTTLETQYASHPNTCPLLPRLRDVEAATAASTKTEEEKKADERTRKRDLFLWKLGFIGTLIMFILSTIVNWF
jgi:hypothetical protein